MPSRSRKKVLVSIPTAQYAERLKLEGVLRFAHDILARRALAEAEDLLAHTDRPIGEIAEQCGFSSASHLSLRLKEACGKTPLAYRKNGPRCRIDSSATELTPGPGRASRRPDGGPDRAPQDSVR